jgi:hypothetical protein
MLSRTEDVPYCDSFLVEEDFIIAMPPNCNTSCVFRASYCTIWFKQPFIKSIILSNSKKEI